MFTVDSVTDSGSKRKKAQQGVAIGGKGQKEQGHLDPPPSGRGSTTNVGGGRGAAFTVTACDASGYSQGGEGARGAGSGGGSRKNVGGDKGVAFDLTGSLSVFDFCLRCVGISRRWRGGKG